MFRVPPPFILFLHIPKTAGTTLRSVADLQFGRKNVITFYHQKTSDTLNNLDYLLRDDRYDFRALIGHFRFGVHENLSQQAEYVTFLRDPVSLTISAYNERLKTFKAEFEKPNGGIKSVEEYLCEHHVAYSNWQTKLVAGTASEVMATEEDLETAMYNLENHFAMAAPMERFDEALLFLSRRLGWGPCLYGTLNKGRPHDFVSPGERALIEEMCRLDRRLLDFATVKFEASLAGEGPLFTAALSELQEARAVPDFQKQIETHLDAAWLTDLPLLSAYLGASTS